MSPLCVLALILGLNYVSGYNELHLKVSLALPISSYPLYERDVHTRMSEILSGDGSAIQFTSVSSGSVVLALTISPPFTAVERWLDGIVGLVNRTAAVPVSLASGTVGIHLEPPTDLIRIARTIIHSQAAVTAALGSAVGYDVIDLHPHFDPADSTAERTAIKSSFLRTIPRLRITTKCPFTLRSEPPPSAAVARVVDAAFVGPQAARLAPGPLTGPFVAPVSYRSTATVTTSVVRSSVSTPAPTAASAPATAAAVAAATAAAAADDVPPVIYDFIVGGLPPAAVVGVAAAAATAAARGWDGDTIRRATAADDAAVAAGERPQWGAALSRPAGWPSESSAICGLVAVAAYVDGRDVHVARRRTGGVDLAATLPAGTTAGLGALGAAAAIGADVRSASGAGDAAGAYVWVGTAPRLGGGGRCCVHGTSVCVSHGVLGRRAVEVCWCRCIEGYTGRACESTVGGVVTTAPTVGLTRKAPAARCADAIACERAGGVMWSDTLDPPPAGQRWVLHGGEVSLTDCSLSVDGGSWTPFFEFPSRQAARTALALIGASELFPIGGVDGPVRGKGMWMGVLPPDFGVDSELLVACDDAQWFVVTLPPAVLNVMLGRRAPNAEGWHRVLYSRLIRGSGALLPTMAFVSRRGLVLTNDEGTEVLALHMDYERACDGDLLRIWYR